MEIREYLFAPEEKLPLVVEPTSGEGATSGDLISLIAKEKESLESKLLDHGAILFRGFGVNSPGAFRRVVKAASSGTLDYVDGNSPRTKLASGVYTSTEYPAQYFISLHNELSYAQRWPRRIFFCCIIAAESGGETVLADSRRLLKSLPQDLVEEFTHRKVKYIRNLHGGDGLGPSWQKTFETEKREDAEAYFRETGTSFEWLEGNRLRVSHVRSAVTRHPLTQEEIWFNQADQFHPSTHPKEVYESLMSMYENREENLPQNVVFGDGGEIGVEHLDIVRKKTAEITVYFPWQKGDFLMVDNMLVSHGRAPFTGDRRILASMSDPCEATD